MKPHPTLLFESGASARGICSSRVAFTLIAVLCVLLLSSAATRAQSLFVSSQAAANVGAQEGVERFNPTTGAFELNFSPGLPTVGIAFGPTGDLFAASFEGAAVYQIDGTTGQLKTRISGSEVARPIGLTVGPDGDVYVTDNANNRVVRYDGRSGAYKGVFASGGGLISPWHLVFGPDGDLYVTSSSNGHILRYNGTTGAFKSLFASSATVQTVFGIAFGPDGNIYVSASMNDPIFRFNGRTGAFMGPFTSGRSLVNADGVVFGPEGDLYVANYSLREVARFDGTTGAFKLAISDSKLGNPSGVTFTPEANVLNISTRLAVQTGDNVLIAGFIVAGKDPKNVVLRAIGPSLGSGVANELRDPILELHNGAGALLASNDNWKDSQQAAIEATGIAPTNDAESAIVATLAPGNYTAVVRGVNDSTGVGLAEVYDLNQATPSQLANVSTRGFVDTGDNVMIGGFIARPAGGTGTRVILRAIGPSLGDAVANPLADPTLELRDGSGTLVASNDNWKDSQRAEIEATEVAPTDDAESAIVADLAPGPYTAIVRGKGDTTGVALVELYSLN